MIPPCQLPRFFTPVSYCSSHRVELHSIYSNCFAPSSSIESYRSAWSLAEAKLGTIHTWEAEDIAEATYSVNLLIATLYRRFYVRLRGYPWTLPILVDEGESMFVRQHIAEEVLRSPRCCLGPYLTERLREYALQDAQDCFLPRAQRCSVSVLQFCNHHKNSG